MQTLRELIAEAPVFAGLGEAHLEVVAGCAQTGRAAPDTLLLREGAPADRFYLIRQGAVALEVHAPGREPLRITTLHEGDVVGWSWLFEPFRWHMDGRTTTECALIGFDGACVRRKCETDHELGYELMRRFAANVIDRLQATRLQLLDVYGRASLHA
jgi:CRP/FNR family cyclic AMP-dependent transcriptional regulator